MSFQGYPAIGPGRGPVVAPNDLHNRPTYHTDNRSLHALSAHYHRLSADTLRAIIEHAFHKGYLALGDKVALKVYDIVSGYGTQLAAYLRNAPKLDIAFSANWTGRTLVHYTATQRDIPTLHRLLAARANVNARDRNGDTALTLAAGEGMVDVVQVLLSANAGINAQDHGGVTPLIAAVVGGHMPTVSLLLQSHADVRPRTRDGATALLFAVAHGRKKIVRALLDARSDVNAVDIYQLSVLTHAVEHDDEDIVNMLLRAGGDANVPVGGFTPLMAAAARGYGSIVSMLLHAKADPRVVCSNGHNTVVGSGRTAAAIAQENGHRAVAQMLHAAATGVLPPPPSSPPPPPAHTHHSQQASSSSFLQQSMASSPLLSAPSSSTPLLSAPLQATSFLTSPQPSTTTPGLPSFRPSTPLLSSVPPATPPTLPSTTPLLSTAFPSPPLLSAPLSAPLSSSLSSPPPRYSPMHTDTDRDRDTDTHAPPAQSSSPSSAAQTTTPPSASSSFPTLASSRYPSLSTVTPASPCISAASSRTPSTAPVAGTSHATTVVTTAVNTSSAATLVAAPGIVTTEVTTTSAIAASSTTVITVGIAGATHNDDVQDSVNASGSCSVAEGVAHGCDVHISDVSGMRSCDADALLPSLSELSYSLTPLPGMTTCTTAETCPDIEADTGAETTHETTACNVGSGSSDDIASGSVSAAATVTRIITCSNVSKKVSQAEVRQPEEGRSRQEREEAKEEDSQEREEDKEREREGEGELAEQEKAALSKEGGADARGFRPKRSEEEGRGEGDVSAEAESRSEELIDGGAGRKQGRAEDTAEGPRGVEIRACAEDIAGGSCVSTGTGISRGDTGVLRDIVDSNTASSAIIQKFKRDDDLDDNHENEVDSNRQGIACGVANTVSREGSRLPAKRNCTAVAIAGVVNEDSEEDVNTEREDDDAVDEGEYGDDNGAAYDGHLRSHLYHKSLATCSNTGCITGVAHAAYGNDTVYKGCDSCKSQDTCIGDDSGVDAEVTIIDFVSACIRGDHNTVARGLSLEMDPNVLVSRGVSVLQYASERGFAGVVRVLAAAGARVDAVDRDGKTPLRVASERGHGAVVRELLPHVLQRGGAAQPRVRGRRGGLTLARLVKACRRGHSAVVEAALRAGVAVDMIVGEGKTLLLHAAECGQVGLIRCLLAAKANINAQDTRGRTALLLAVIHSCDGAVDALLQAGADVHVRDCGGQSPLTHAVTALMHSTAACAMDIVKRLVAHGAVATRHDHVIGDALLQVIAKGKSEHVHLLLSAKADARRRNRQRQDVLMLTIEHGHASPNRFAQLLRSDVDVHARDCRGRTALVYAVERGLLNIATMVVESPKNTGPARAGTLGRALGVASGLGDCAMVQMLLAAKAPVHTLNEAGETALICAVRAGHEQVVELLLSAGAGTVDAGTCARAGTVGAGADEVPGTAAAAAKRAAVCREGKAGWSMVEMMDPLEGVRIETSTSAVDEAIGGPRQGSMVGLAEAIVVENVMMMEHDVVESPEEVMAHPLEEAVMVSVEHGDVVMTELLLRHVYGQTGYGGDDYDDYGDYSGGGDCGGKERARPCDDNCDGDRQGSARRHDNRNGRGCGEDASGDQGSAGDDRSNINDVHECVDCDLSSGRDWRMRPLMRAAMRGDADMVRCLLRARAMTCATVCARDLHGWTAFHYAVKYDHADVLTALLGTRVPGHEHGTGTGTSTGTCASAISASLQDFNTLAAFVPNVAVCARMRACVHAARQYAIKCGKTHLLPLLSSPPLPSLSAVTSSQSPRPPLPAPLASLSSLPVSPAAVVEAGGGVIEASDAGAKQQAVKTYGIEAYGAKGGGVAVGRSDSVDGHGVGECVRLSACVNASRSAGACRSARASENGVNANTCTRMDVKSAVECIAENGGENGVERDVCDTSLECGIEDGVDATTTASLTQPASLLCESSSVCVGEDFSDEEGSDCVYVEA